MIHHRWVVLLLVWAGASVLQWCLYAVQRRTRDASTVDVGWGVSLAAAAIFCAAVSPGDASHRILIGLLPALESLRLALLVVRRLGHGEDSRYADLRTRWAARGREQVSFAVFFQAQAAIIPILSLPFVLAAFNHTGRLEPVEWAGAALWLVAVVFETLADRQLARFRADPANKGKTLRTGLWATSRHPNYFFQTLTWLAYGLIAVAAPWGYLGFVGYVLILVLVLFVSGIPPIEERALRTRGEEFVRYRETTSAFVPWFPKRERRIL